MPSTGPSTDQDSSAAPRSACQLSSDGASEMTRAIAVPPDRSGIDARRRDEPIARRERAAQRVEDCEGELQRLEQEHLEIGRPDRRLWYGIAIVVVFMLVGVALPLWAMSQGGKNLASVQRMFWPFTTAVALLVIYIVV